VSRTDGLPRADPQNEFTHSIPNPGNGDTLKKAMYEKPIVYENTGESHDDAQVLYQRGLFFEELAEGVIYCHAPGRTVGEADNTFFSTLTMNPASIHLDAFASANTEFGQRLVNSMFTLSTVVGLSVAQLTQNTTIANLGFETVSFPRPLFVGDTLYASTKVESMRPSGSRPDAGIVTFEHLGRNQRDEVVAVARRVALMRRRDATAP
jgi:acyl dehydratase